MKITISQLHKILVTVIAAIISMIGIFNCQTAQAVDNSIPTIRPPLNFRFAGPVNVRSFGAVPDDAIPDTAQINYAITVAREVVIPGGTFLIDATVGISLHSHSKLILSPDTVLKVIATDQDRYALINVAEKTNVVIDGNGARLIGDRGSHLGTMGEWGFGVKIVGSTNVVVSRLNISKMCGDGLYIGYSKSASSHIKVEDVVCNSNRRQGLSIVSATDLEVNNCRFLNTNGTPPQAGVDSEPNPNRPANQRCRFTNCIFKNNTGSGFTSPFEDGTRDFVFENCTFYGMQNTAPHGHALWWKALGQNIFNQCRFYGVVSVKNNAAFIDCYFYADDTYCQQSVYAFNATLDAPGVFMERCTFESAGVMRAALIYGSTTKKNSKTLRSCRFLKNGDRGSDIALSVTGFATIEDCRLEHIGAKPATPYRIRVDTAAPETEVTGCISTTANFVCP